MRLTLCLLIGKPKLRFPEGFKGPKGNIFSGKHRLVKKVTNEAVKDFREDIKLEEKNMYFLRHPYLTLEQSYGHAQALGKREKWATKFRQQTDHKFTSTFNRSVVGYLQQLNISEDWDKIPS